MRASGQKVIYRNGRFWRKAALENYAPGFFSRNGYPLLENASFEREWPVHPFSDMK
jgi:hypothetical protein